MRGDQKTHSILSSSYSFTPPISYFIIHCLHSFINSLQPLKFSPNVPFANSIYVFESSFCTELNN